MWNNRTVLFRCVFCAKTEEILHRSNRNKLDRMGMFILFSGVRCFRGLYRALIMLQQIEKIDCLCRILREIAERSGHQTGNVLVKSIHCREAKSLDHKIIYMNLAAAANYHKYGGAELLGKSLLDCHGAHSNERIKEVVSWFAKSEENNLIYTSHNEKQNKDVYMVALRDADKKLIGYYEKHEYRNKENMEKYQM